MGPEPNDYELLTEKIEDLSLLISATNNLKTDLLQKLENLIARLKSNPDSFDDTSAQEFIQECINIRPILLNILQILYYKKSIKLLKSSEIATTEIAGNVLAKFFDKSHNDFEDDNKKWLCRIIVLSLLIFIVNLFFNSIFCWTQNLFCSNMINIDFDLNNTKQLFVYAFSKITIVGTLIYGLIFSIKNYNSNRHNSILNKHRATALLSYPAIFDVAGADKQDIILTQISDCMFKHQDTGFGKPDDSGPSWEQMLNLLTKAMGKDK